MTQPWYKNARLWADIATFAGAIASLGSAYVLNVSFLGERTAAEIAAGIGFANGLMQAGVTIFAHMKGPQPA